MREKKYLKKVISKLISTHIITLGNSILVIGGTSQENDLFHSLGFRNVTLTNITQINLEYLRYQFIKQDGMRLDFPDNSYDVEFVANSLHHMSRPHLALTEMYRVARKGLILLESNDSVLIRLLCILRLVDKYEVSVEDGIKTTNYVYRWTEREIKKTIYSYDPSYSNKFLFYYALHLPVKGIRRILGIILYPFLLILQCIKQTNSLFALIMKQ